MFWNTSKLNKDKEYMNKNKLYNYIFNLIGDNSIKIIIFKKK